MYEYKLKDFDPATVYDGDTLLGVRIDLGFHIYTVINMRLLGIDTPEIRTRDPEEKKRGYEAKEALVSLLSSAIEIRVKTQGTGKFGRWLATIYITDTNGDNIDVNDWLIFKGYAKPYPE